MVRDEGRIAAGQEAAKAIGKTIPEPWIAWENVDGERRTIGDYVFRQEHEDALGGYRKGLDLGGSLLGMTAKDGDEAKGLVEQIAATMKKPFIYVADRPVRPLEVETGVRVGDALAAGAVVAIEAEKLESPELGHQFTTLPHPERDVFVYRRYAGGLPAGIGKHREADILIVETGQKVSVGPYQAPFYDDKA